MIGFTQPSESPQMVEIRRSLPYSQSVATTGGVYKWQGRNQYKLMTCAY